MRKPQTPHLTRESYMHTFKHICVAVSVLSIQRCIFTILTGYEWHGRRPWQRVSQDGLIAGRGGNNLPRSRMLRFGPKYGHMDLVVTVVGGQQGD